MDTRTSPARLNIERIRAVLEGERLRRGADSVERSAPLGIPARALAGPAVGLRLHRLGGTLALTLEKAALFVDSRYWVQAERELAGSGIELVKTPSPGATTTANGCAATRRRRDRRGRRRRARPRCRAPAAAPSSRRAAPRCAATSTSSPARGTAGRRRRRRRSTSTAPRRRPSRGRSGWARSAPRWVRPGRPTISSRPSTTSPDPQPARRRRQLQPGLPRPPADRPRHARRCSSPRPRSTRRWPPRSPPTACASRPTKRPAPRSPRCPRAPPCCSTRSG